MKNNKKKSLLTWTAIALCAIPSLPVNGMGHVPASTYAAEKASATAKSALTPVFAASTDAALLTPVDETTSGFKLKLPAHFMRKPAYHAAPVQESPYATVAFNATQLPPGLTERMVPIFKPGTIAPIALHIAPTTRARAVAPQQIVARYAAPKTAAAIAARLHRKPANNTNNKENFEEMQVVSNEELSNIRGGFLTSNGMILDLGLTTQTIVNGTTVQQTILSPEALKTVDPSTLRTLVRVTEGSASSSNLTSSDIPEIVNVIQNEASNVKIDQITTLNIDVQNVQQFKLQIQTPGLDYGTVINMR